MTSPRSKRGYTGFVLAKMARLQGASGIQIGTMGFGKMEGEAADKAIAHMIANGAEALAAGSAVFKGGRTAYAATSQRCGGRRSSISCILRLSPFRPVADLGGEIRSRLMGEVLGDVDNVLIGEAALTLRIFGRVRDRHVRLDKGRGGERPRDSSADVE